MEHNTESTRLCLAIDCWKPANDLCEEHKQEYHGIITAFCFHCGKGPVLPTWDRCERCLKQDLWREYSRYGKPENVAANYELLRRYRELGTVEELIDMQCRLDIHQHSLELGLEASNVSSTDRK